MSVPWKYLKLFPLTFAYTSIAGYTNVLNILNPHSPISDWMSTTIIVCYAESGKWAGFVPDDHLKRRDLHCFLCYNLSLHRCTQFSIFPTFFFLPPHCNSFVQSCVSFFWLDIILWLLIIVESATDCIYKYSNSLCLSITSSCLSDSF